MPLPEFRLYYDSNGNVLHYTCEQSTGNFIVIDALTYAEGRYDIRVVNKKIEKVQYVLTISKLAPNKIGVPCTSEDISIVAPNYINSTNWKLIYVNNN